MPKAHAQIGRPVATTQSISTLIAILSIIQEAPDTANDHHQLVQTDNYHLSHPTNRRWQGAVSM
jgi:hypothetical protein